MRRTLEKLAADRENHEQALSRRLEDLKKKTSGETSSRTSFAVKNLINRLEDILKTEEKRPRALKKGFFKRSRAEDAAAGASFKPAADQILLILREFDQLLARHLSRSQEILGSLVQLSEENAVLADARDREWDALGSNHVGMIFKSMEWKVDKLAAECEDAQILMKKLFLLREKMDRLLQTLEEKRLPAAREVKDILEPLEDWRYSGFENRFRGYEEEVKKQQAVYLPCFKPGGKVLDLGCGRGEFMELLLENGFEAVGVDLNSQMVDICLDKGLNVRRGDILQALEGFKDGSFAGIFSSQVIEHVSPEYLKRLVELSRAKLESGGNIVLETINPTSVFALVQIYFLDPSHQKPVHPQALKFLLEGAGFDDVEIRYSFPLKKERLQPLPGADDRTSILNRNIDALNDLLFAPPNYAAVGRKD